MKKQKIKKIRKLAHSIDSRINLFEGLVSKETSTYKGELLFWRQIVNMYGLFADCDRVQVKEKHNLIELMKRYNLLNRDEYEFIRSFWNDVAELRKWFCHNNDDTLYYHAIRKSKIEKYLDQAFVLATNKPATMDSVQQNDWTVLNFNIESRLDEYLNLMEKAFISWQTSPDKEELISEWVKIQSKALFSDKELIMNVLAEIAEYEILNQGLRNTTPTNMSKVYYSQLEIGGYSQKDIAAEMERGAILKRTNKEIIQDSIRNSGLI